MFLFPQGARLAVPLRGKGFPSFSHTKPSSFAQQAFPSLPIQSAFLFCTRQDLLPFPQTRPSFSSKKKRLGAKSSGSTRAARAAQPAIAGRCLQTAGTLAPQPPAHRRSGPRVPEFRTPSDTDRCEAKYTRLGGGLWDPTTRDKTALASCVLLGTYQPQCRLKKDSRRCCRDRAGAARTHLQMTPRGRSTSCRRTVVGVGRDRGGAARTHL